MTICYDDGLLRAYLDDAVPTDEHSAIEAHLSSCPFCDARVEELEARARQVRALLSPDDAHSDSWSALIRIRQLRHSDNDKVGPTARDDAAALISLSDITRRIPMETKTSGWLYTTRRKVFTSIAALIALLALLAFPPVRAAADQLLRIFRVQQVIFMPISDERLQQLEDLKFDQTTLFVAPPQIVNQPAQPQTVDTLEEANRLAGFDIRQPATIAGAATSTTFTIADRTTFQFQVNVEASQQLLTLMNIHDVTIPEALGAAPITAEVPKFVEATYRGSEYTLHVIQGPSPQVSLPDGVDLAQLGKAALRLLGMDPLQAETLSQNIDWSSTLIIPFPSGMQEIQQVMVGDTHGMLVGSGQGGGQLYWQRGDRFYVIYGKGNIRDVDLITIAESINE